MTPGKLYTTIVEESIGCFHSAWSYRLGYWVWWAEQGTTGKVILCVEGPCQQNMHFDRPGYKILHDGQLWFLEKKVADRIMLEIETNSQ